MNDLENKDGNRTSSSWDAQNRPTEHGGDEATSGAGIQHWMVSILRFGGQVRISNYETLNHREVFFDNILTTLGTKTNKQHDKQGYKAPLSIRMDDCILSQPGGQGGGMTLSSVEEAFQGMSNALAQVLAQLR